MNPVEEMIEGADLEVADYFSYMLEGENTKELLGFLKEAYCSVRRFLERIVLLEQMRLRSFFISNWCNELK